MSDTWVITFPDGYKPSRLVEKIRKPNTSKSNLTGFVSDYKKLYDIVKAMDDDNGSMNSLGWAVGDLDYHCSRETADRERIIYNNIEKTYKAFLNALEDALGIESKYTEWEKENGLNE